MNLSALAFRNQPVVFLVAVILMIFGIVSYFNLPAREDPAILVRDAVVVTTYPGLDAEQVEMLITKPLEEAIITLPELKEVKSTSMGGTSIIHAIVEDKYTDLEGIFDQLAETVEESRERLPEGTLPPNIIDDFGDVAVITLALWGDDYGLGESYDYAQHVRDRLLVLDGLKKVEILGSQEERIFVEYDNAVLSQSGVTPASLSAALSTQNIIRPGGQIDIGDTALLIRPSGDIPDVDALSDLLIQTQGDNGVVRLGDIATVTRGYLDPPRDKAFFNGEESLVLSVSMQQEESVINFAKRAEPLIAEIRAELPVGLNLDVITWQADQVETTVYGVSINMLQTLAIVLGVVILFLGLRVGLIVGAIIPGVILATLGIMGLFGMPLERMSLATLIISLGLLVDNGIVVAEDFQRRLGELGDRDEALKATSRELALPLLASSFTTIAVFLPLLIAQTASSEYTRSITLVIMIALSVSWLFAMTVTTTLCHRFIKKPSEETAGKGLRARIMGSIFGTLENVYGGVLRFIIRLRWIYVIFMIGLFGFGGYLMGQVPNRFFPDSDRAQLLVYVDAPADVTARVTEERMKRLAAIVTDKDSYPSVEDVVSYVGFGGPRFVLSLTPIDPAPNRGFMLINVEDIQTAEAIIPQLRNDFRARVPDVNARVSRMFLGPADTNTIQVQMRGPDADYIVEKSKELERILLDVPDMIDVWSDWYERAEQLDVVIDQAEARRAGVTSTDIAQTLAGYVEGAPVGEIREGDEVLPIILRGQEDERSSIDRLRSLAVYSRITGASVPLSQVATLERTPGFTFIQREDLVRTVTVEGRNMLRTPEDMAPLLQPKIDALNAELEPGHFVEFDGILDETASTNAALAATGPIVLALIVLALVAQFNGFRRPIILLLCLPFVIIGAAPGLLLMGADFGFMVILGLYALMGIIINNSIVLVDRIDIQQDELDEDASNAERLDALINACSRRLRPILMATITTIIGLLPLILFKDVLFYGMAVAIAFGLGIGTFFISLGFTPVLYSLFFGIKSKRGETARRSTELDVSREGVPA
ncbi:MAG: efflux RND transporter permease subunit [Litorimonas sp.]